MSNHDDIDTIGPGEVPPPESDEDWERVTGGHAFIGMTVAVETDAREVEGMITAIWELRGDPTRFDVQIEGDELLNVNPQSDHVEVQG